MTFKPPKGFTAIELLIIFVIAGGQWSEGIQYGRMTQLCTYN